MPSAPYRSPIAIAPKGSLAQFASLIERPANDAAPKAGRLGMEPGRHDKATPPHKDTRAERLPMEATRASPPPRGAPSKAPSSLHLTREVLAIFGQEEPVTPHPREAYRGVAVSALEQHGEVVFHIALRHHEAERSVALAHGTDVARSHEPGTPGRRRSRSRSSLRRPAEPARHGSPRWGSCWWSAAAPAGAARRSSAAARAMPAAADPACRSTLRRSR